MRLLPRFLHTRGVRARLRVDDLSRTQRERLRQNLAAMLRPETA